MFDYIIFPTVAADTPANQLQWFLAGYMWAMGFGLVGFMIKLVAKICSNKIDL